MLKSWRTLYFFNIQTKLKINGIYPIINYSKDIISSSKNDDYLLSDLKNVNSSVSILNLVGRHITIMNHQHILQVFKTLFALQKSEKSGLSKEEILHNSNFEVLCQYLRKHVRKIEVNDAVEALKTLSYLGVRGDSKIVQAILQMLRHYINDLTLQQLFFLDYVLNKMQRSALRDALCIALPIVFEAQVTYKLDRGNIKDLISCLYYISKKKIGDKCKKQIVDALMENLESGCLLNGEQAKSILWSISQIKENDMFEPLIDSAISHFLRDISSLNFDEVESTIQFLFRRYSEKYPFYYSAQLCDGIVNHFVEKDKGFQNGIYLLNKLSRMDHFSDVLINYLSEKVESNPNLIVRGSYPSVFILSEAIAATDYRPPQWDVLKQYIYEANCLKSSISNDFAPPIKLCSSLCILDIFREETFKNCLNKDYINSLFTKKNRTDVSNFLTVYQTISAFKPNYMYLMPSQNVINELLEDKQDEVDFPLKAPLEKALGGDIYVSSNMKTREGHHIDHVVMLRKGGYPIPFTKQEKFIEDIETSIENSTVLILTLRPRHFPLNCRRLKGNVSQVIKTLEIRGYSVVPIYLEEWQRLPDFEKIPYFMREIKLKVDEFREISSVY